MKVFIGYRRDDAGGTAGRIYDRLVDHFGRRHIFRDVDAIDAGVDFVATVRASIADARAMLVVMGPDWLRITDADGRIRLDDPADYVRTEVRLALAEPDLRVIPVLVDGATMPAPDALPDDIRSLALRNAVEIRNTRFDDDVDHLIEQIGRAGVVRRLWRERRGVLVVASAMALAVSALVLRLAGGGVEPLTGDFNFAVADFAAVGEAEPDTARTLALSVFGVIDGILAGFEEAGEFTNAEVADPAKTGPVDGASIEERAASAAQLAGRLNADVVLVGTLDASGGVSRFDSEFYLSERNLRNAEELAGAYSLGRIELNTTDPLAVSRAVTQRFESQAHAIAELVVGLSYYAVSDYSTAYDHLQVASSSWNPAAGGQEVVLQLLGNATGELGPDRWEEARGYYEQALAANPSYARAEFGLAELDFLDARGAECSGDPEQPPADPVALRAVADQFRRIATLPAPPLSLLDVRSELEIGRILLCLGVLDPRLLPEAAAQMEAVVARYDGSNERLRNLVAEAFRSLAFHDILLGDYQGALNRYEQAIDLSLDPTAEATMWSSRGDVYACFLGDPIAAEREYAEAESLTGTPAPRAAC